MSMRVVKELLLLRHGQTDWNVARRYQGQTDTPLNASGIQQMQGVAMGLKSELIDRVVSSPLRRAVSSAELIATAKSLPIQTDARLMELDLGAWQGQPYGLKRGVENWFYDAPHGGERGTDFCARLAEWLGEVESGVTVVVAHGLVIQVLLMLACGGTFEEWHETPIKNGAVTQVRLVTNGWTLKRFNQELAGEQGCSRHG